MSVLSEFESELVAAWREKPTLWSRTSESESGLGTARALSGIVDQLSRQAAGDPLSPSDQQHTFALALRQVDDQGRPVNRQLNKPDISYLGDVGGTRRRVNIEIETQDLNRHVAPVNNDPQAHNVFLKIDPWTGAILGGLERTPGGSTLRPLSADEAKNAIGQLPKPQRDSTLAVDPRTGAQIRRPPAGPNARPAPRPRSSATRTPATRAGAATPRTTGPARASGGRTARPRGKAGRPARELEAELAAELEQALRDIRS